MFIHDQAVNFKSAPFVIHLLRRMKAGLNEKQGPKERSSYAGLNIHAGWEGIMEKRSHKKIPNQSNMIIACKN